MSDSYIKDPSAELVYTVNWASEDGTNDGGSSDTGWLQGDTIATSTWIVPDGLTAGVESKTTTQAAIKLSGGTVGQTYTVVNRITTASSPQLIDDRSIVIKIRQK